MLVRAEPIRQMLCTLKGTTLSIQHQHKYGVIENVREIKLTTGVAISHTTDEHHGSLTTTSIDPSHLGTSSPNDRRRRDGGPVPFVKVHGMCEAIAGARARHTSDHNKTGFVRGDGHACESMWREAVVCSQRECRFGGVELHATSVSLSYRFSNRVPGVGTHG